MKAILAILVTFTSYIVNCQTYIETQKGTVICFDSAGAKKILDNYNELIYLRVKDSLQAEVQTILLCVLDSCEKQRANDAYKIDTLVNICKQQDERNKVLIQEKKIEQKTLFEYKSKNNNKNWGLITLLLLSIIGFAT